MNGYLTNAKNNFGKTEQSAKPPHHVKNPFTRSKVTTERWKTVKADTVAETIKHFREGKNIEQISAERNLVISTIESHLAKAIGQKLISIEEVIPIEEARKIAGYFPEDLSDVRLAGIKEKTPDEITYGKLRMVLEWLRSELPHK